jgi:hypothetical protein
MYTRRITKSTNGHLCPFVLARDGDAYVIIAGQGPALLGNFLNKIKKHHFALPKAKKR